MRNFLQIAANLDFTPLLQDLMRREELWNQFRVRTFHQQSAHREIDDIVLRYNRFEPGDDFVDMVCSRIAVENYPAMHELPEARRLAMWLMARVGGEHLGRCFISRMRPGVAIGPHHDRIGPAEIAFPDRIPPAVYYERYQFALLSARGVTFRCGDEVVWMEPGSVWWFNNQIEHEVLNGSAHDRISMVVDIHLADGGYVPGWDQGGAS